MGTVDETLNDLAQIFPRAIAEELFTTALDVPRYWHRSNAEHILSDEERAAVDEAARRLAEGMPLAYAARRAAFRMLTLYVDERVLIPRPETEVLVGLVLDATHGGHGTAIDVGTGSGCIALSLATEGRFARVIATDVSPDALAVARMNGELRKASGALKAKVEFRRGSYLAPCRRDKASVVVSNPPYISRDERDELPELVRDWEPEDALFADDDGMAAIVAIATESAAVLEPGGLLAMEVDSRRAGSALQLVEAVGAYRDGVVRPDLTGRARFVLARRAEA